MVDINELLNQKEGFIFDLDGVIWRGEEVIEGAPEVIEKLRSLDKELAFVSNNSSMSRLEVKDKLEELGVPVSLKEIFNTPFAARHYIKERSPDAEVFVLGMDGVKEEMTRGGLEVATDAENPNYLVAGYDRNLDYEKLSRALNVLLQDASYIALNDDGMLPTTDGYLPGAGATVGAINGMIKCSPDVTIGKPNDFLLEMALEFMELEPESCLFIGDSLETDILLANKNKVDSILLMSGNTRDREEIKNSEIEPDHVFPSIRYILKHLKK